MDFFVTPMVFVDVLVHRVVPQARLVSKIAVWTVVPCSNAKATRSVKKANVWRIRAINLDVLEIYFAKNPNVSPIPVATFNVEVERTVARGFVWVLVLMCNVPPEKYVRTVLVSLVPVAKMAVKLDKSAVTISVWSIPAREKLVVSNAFVSTDIVSMIPVSV